MIRVRLLLLTEEIDASAKKARMAKVSGAGMKHTLIAALPTQDLHRSLTPRQTQVLRAMALGRRTKVIARELGISVKTVETHRQKLIQRLGIKDIPSLVRYALKSGVLPARWLLGKGGGAR